MDTHRKFLTATALTFGAAFTWASAQAPSSSSGIERGSVDGLAFQNGGIGAEETAQMDRHLRPYDLRLTFSEGRENAYAAGVHVRITDAAGKTVFRLDDAGPLTDVKVPAGRYRVLADFGGVRRSGMVDVGPGRPADLHLHWSKDA